MAETVRKLAFAFLLIGAAVGPLVPTISVTSRSAQDPGFALPLIVHLLFAVAASLWLISMALEGRLRLRRLGLGPWWILFAGAVLASIVNAGCKYPAALTVFLWLTDMAAFLVLVNIARSQRARLLILSAICASTFVVVLHGIHQHEIDFPQWLRRVSQDPAAVLRSLNMPPELGYDLRGRIGSMRVFSTFILPNSFAGYLLLACPAFVGLLLDRYGRGENVRRNLTRLVGLIFVSPMLLAFYFTKSKGGALALVAAICVFLVWAFRKTIRKHRAKVIIILLAAALVAGIAQASGLFASMNEYLGSFNVRAGYWRAGTLIIEDHPFTGVGLENFSDFYAQKKRPQDQEARRAHNDYIQIGAEIGLVGLLLYLIGWAAFWRRVRRRETEPVLPAPENSMSPPLLFAFIILLGLVTFFLAWRCGGALQGSPEWFGSAWPIMLLIAWLGVMTFFAGARPAHGPVRNSYATIGIAAGLAGFLVHSLLDFDHYVAGIFQTVWIFAAILLTARFSEEKEILLLDKPLGIPSRLAIIIAATAAPFLLSHKFILPVIDANSFRAIAIETQDLRQKQELVENAIARWKWDPQSHAQLAALLLGRSYHSTIVGPAGETAISQAITHMREAVRLAPYRAGYYSRLGWLYEQRWRRSSPHNPADWQNAIAAYSRAEELAPSIPDTALNLARIHDIAGQYQLALGKYFRALEISRNHYHIWRQFKGKSLAELEARVNLLNASITTGKQIPPPTFTTPRLLGLPPSAWVAKSQDTAQTPAADTP